MRMIQVKLAAAVGTWRSNAFEMKDGKRKMSAFLNRMINRKMSASFERVALGTKNRGREPVLGVLTVMFAGVLQSELAVFLGLIRTVMTVTDFY